MRRSLHFPRSHRAARDAACRGKATGNPEHTDTQCYRTGRGDHSRSGRARPSSRTGFQDDGAAAWTGTTAARAG